MLDVDDKCANVYLSKYHNHHIVVMRGVTFCILIGLIIILLPGKHCDIVVNKMWQKLRNFVWVFKIICEQSANEYIISSHSL